MTTNRIFWSTALFLLRVQNDDVSIKMQIKKGINHPGQSTGVAS